MVGAGNQPAAPTATLYSLLFGIPVLGLIGAGRRPPMVGRLLI
jgi:hypothetical protein